ncbi:hypothetical protein QYM36_012410 [Artemia franciscana]|uniref:Uncharacterized protein n=1 Tax=Artemia franciscana TaxID=6661 RepID=A0AA88HFV5_ARTSF|nr:hypothetical protein QYM36_012410 [Artemia franciscana]
MFYAELNEAVKKTPKRDLLFIGGDLTAHVSSRQENSDRNLGIHRRKPSHVITRRSRGERKSSQLEYLLVSLRWRSLIQNCRAYRKPDIGFKCGSDHTLVKMSMKIRLMARKRKEIPKRFDVAHLKELAVVEQFRLPLSNRFTTLEHEHSMSVLRTGTRANRRLTNIGRSS